jgi:UDP-N-acetylmuramate dehydrogenase
MRRRDALAASGCGFVSDARAQLDIPGCTLLENASLLERTTFRVPARTAIFIEVAQSDVLPALLQAPVLRDVEILVLGGGSNILFTRDWPGAIVSLATRGIEVIDDRSDAAIVRCAAGENWNDLVWWSLDHGFMGLENLALIPGRVGAAPIQNIGAYGAEVNEFVHAVHAFDRQLRRSVRLSNTDCAFAYRDSAFKHEPNRYLIMTVDFLLPRQRSLRIEYSGLPEELAAMGTGTPDARAVATAVTRLRTRKLPDPGVVGNAGSFFKNPVVTLAHADALRAENPTLPIWPMPNQTAKLSAAWLIESCNFKGLREGSAGVSSNHALVMVNYGQASGAQILALARQIQAQVAQRFDVQLEIEPIVV